MKKEPIFNPGRLQEIREEHDLKKSEMARIMNVDRSTLLRYEEGLSPVPTEKFIIVADLYNYSLDYVVGRSRAKELIAPMDPRFRPYEHIHYNELVLAAEEEQNVIKSK